MAEKQNEVELRKIQASAALNKRDTKGRTFSTDLNGKRVLVETVDIKQLRVLNQVPKWAEQVQTP